MQFAGFGRRAIYAHLTLSIVTCAAYRPPRRLIIPTYRHGDSDLIRGDDAD